MSQPLKFYCMNPITTRKARIPQSFGLSVWSLVKPLLCQSFERCEKLLFYCFYMYRRDVFLSFA